MYVGSYANCVLNWNWWLTQDHFLIKHWSQRTQRCSARVVGLERYSLVLVSRYSTMRSGTLTWREWGLWSERSDSSRLLVCECGWSADLGGGCQFEPFGDGFWPPDIGLGVQPDVLGHSHSALFDVVTPPLSCPFSYLYIGPSYPTPNA